MHGFWLSPQARILVPPPQEGRGAWMMGEEGRAQAQNSLRWQNDGGGAGWAAEMDGCVPAMNKTSGSLHPVLSVCRVALPILPGSCLLLCLLDSSAPRGQIARARFGARGGRGHVRGVLPALDRRDGHPGELPGGARRAGRGCPRSRAASGGPRVPGRSLTRPAHHLGVVLLRL